QQLAEAELERPFDLAVGPLLRWGLVRLDGDDHRLWFAVHHIVADGWSAEIIVHELGTLYDAFAAGRRRPLPELPIQYADYACWQHRWLRGEELASRLAWWQGRLGRNPPPLALPTDRPRSPVLSFSGARTRFLLPETLRTGIESLCRRHGVTMYVTLLAAFQLLMARFANQDVVNVGSPVAGRNRAEVEGLVGLFVNTVTLHLDLRGNPTVGELLARVRQASVEVFDHQDVPFDKVVESLQDGRDPSRQPLFQVLFDYQHAVFETLVLKDLSLEPVDVPGRTAKFELALAVGESAAALDGTIEYNSDLFDPATIDRMIGHYRSLLAAFAADPEQRVGEIAVLGEVDRDPLVVAARAAGGGVEVVERPSMEARLANREAELEAERDTLTAAQRAALARLTRRRRRGRNREGKDRTTAPAEVPSIRPRVREGNPPLSFAQQRLWFLDQFEPGSPLFNIPGFLELRGALDPALLAAALGEIVRRHEVLRTTFAVAGGDEEPSICPPPGEPVQVIHPAAARAL
ncbi:MAG: hypothetical protein GY856_37065, partial [bacterium]|nr:hypothetical protein [bacterium]